MWFQERIMMTELDDCGEQARAAVRCECDTQHSDACSSQFAFIRISNLTTAFLPFLQPAPGRPALTFAYGATAGLKQIKKHIMSDSPLV